MLDNDPLVDELYEVCDGCNFIMKRDCELFLSGQVAECAVAGAAVISDSQNYELVVELEKNFARKMKGTAHSYGCRC